MCLGDISVRSLAAHSTGVAPSSDTTLYDFSVTVLMAGQSQTGPMEPPHTKVQCRSTKWQWQHVRLRR